MAGVSAFAMPVPDLNASFTGVYQPDLIIVWKCTTFELDVRLENLKK